MDFEFSELCSATKIKVVGIGGGGGNAINNMIESQLKGVEFIAANTDKQALDASKANIKIQLGAKSTRGLGAGSKPVIGREAAEESEKDIIEALSGSDMVFITAGMGGGTGTGAAPVIAEISKNLGALTVGVVTNPFSFEGKTRMKNATEGLDNLKKKVDTIITIPNDKILSVFSKVPIGKAFQKVDEVLYYAVKGITDIIMVRGYINVDFADVKTVMEQMGIAIMGTGIAQGERRAKEALLMAIENPILSDTSIHGARGILLNIAGNPNSFTADEIMEITQAINEQADDDANIIFGATYDENLGDDLRVTVIATGIGKAESLVSELSHKEALGHEGDKVTSLERFKNSRSTKTCGESCKTNIHINPDTGDYDWSKYDIPTFIRNKAD